MTSPGCLPEMQFFNLDLEMIGLFIACPVEIPGAYASFFIFHNAGSRIASTIIRFAFFGSRELDRTSTTHPTHQKSKTVSLPAS